MKNGGPAFPVTPTDRGGQIADTQCGMTMRQYYKAAALTGLCQKENYAAGMDMPSQTQQIVKRAYMYADAMLAEDEEHDSR